MSKNRGKLLVIALLSIGALIMLFPFFWMVLTSFKTNSESMRIPMTFWPQNPTTANYPRVWQELPWPTLFYNTFAMMFLRVGFSAVTGVMAGYAFGRLEFPGKKVIFMVILAMLMVPSQVFIIPQYMQMAKIGMLDSVFALAWPGLVTAYGVFLMRQAFASLPRELEESAKIDGCGHWRTCWRILTPLTTTSIVSMSVMNALWAFKDLAWPLVVNLSQSKMTLSTALAVMVNDGNAKTDYPLLMAGATISVIPMILLYGFFQKQFVQGVAMSGMK